MKKVLSVVLALVMILSIASVSIISADTPKADCTMMLGETRTVYLPGSIWEDYVIVRFTPLGSGLVAFSSDSTGSVKSDPAVELYDSDMKVCLAKADDNGDDNDFYLEYRVEANKTYYIAMYNHSDVLTNSWDVSIKCLHEYYVNGICSTCLTLCDHKDTDNFVGCCPCGNKYSGTEIKDGDVVPVTLGTRYTWFKFEPTESAAYLLTSDNTDDTSNITQSADPTVVIYDKTGDALIASNDNISEENKNFALPFYFEKGERYYIGVKDNNVLSDNWTLSFNAVTSHTVTVTGEDGTVTTATHTLVYLSEKESNCKEEGHSAAVYCPTCKEYLVGDVYAKAESCKDDNNDNNCDWCGVVIVVDTTPVECGCRCHSSDFFQKIIWSIVNAFNKLFRLDPECDCGVRHW